MLYDLRNRPKFPCAEGPSLSCSHMAWQKEGQKGGHDSTHHRVQQLVLPGSGRPLEPWPSKGASIHLLHGVEARSWRLWAGAGPGRAACTALSRKRRRAGRTCMLRVLGVSGALRGCVRRRQQQQPAKQMPAKQPQRTEPARLRWLPSGKCELPRGGPPVARLPGPPPPVPASAASMCTGSCGQQREHARVVCSGGGERHRGNDHRQEQHDSRAK